MFFNYLPGTDDSYMIDLEVPYLSYYNIFSFKYVPIISAKYFTRSCLRKAFIFLNDFIFLSENRN